MNTPIIDAIIKYLQEDNTVFHMPGHRQGKLFSFIEKRNLLEFDLTEVEGLDNLHCPTGAIAESMELTAEYFGADKTLYSVNGSTAGILAVITGICFEGDTVVIERGCHRSVYNGVALSKARPIYVDGKFDKESGIVLPAHTDEIAETAISNNAKAVVITRPTYYGICSDIQKMCEILHKHNIAVIVDEAHGAHLNAFTDMPRTAMQSGADVCVQSFHKTLPAINQTAVIHIKSNIVDYKRIEKMLSVFQTTSPSYMLMASIDYAREYLKKFSAELSANVKNLLNEKCDILTKETKFKIIKNINGYEFDWLRLVINTSDLAITGYELERVLRKEYSIQVEMSDETNIVCILSLFDFEGKFSPIEKLVRALIDINGKYREEPEDRRFLVDVIKCRPNFPVQKLLPGDALYAQSETIGLKNACGRISADYITPYPPGIPLVCPGELIAKDMIEYITYLFEKGAVINGVTDGEMICVIR